MRRVVKGKSMVSEEVALNDALTADGIEVTETDLGEYIVQLAEQRPTHIVTPALHLSAEEIGKLFHDKLGETTTANHEALTLPRFLYPKGLLAWTRSRELPLVPPVSFRTLWKRKSDR